MQRAVIVTILLLSGFTGVLTADDLAATAQKAATVVSIDTATPDTTQEETTSDDKNQEDEEPDCD